MTYLELNTLSYDVLGDFIESAAHQDERSAPFLLGKAAAYVEAAYSLGLISRGEARELLLCINIYRGVE